jgi:hypothetical protein
MVSSNQINLEIEQIRPDELTEYKSLHPQRTLSFTVAALKDGSNAAFPAFKTGY